MEYRLRKTGKYIFVEYGNYINDIKVAPGEFLSVFRTIDIVFFEDIDLALDYIRKESKCPYYPRIKGQRVFQVESRIDDSYMFENLLGNNVSTATKAEAIAEYKRQLLNRNRNMITMETMNNWEFLVKERV